MEKIFSLDRADRLILRMLQQDASRPIAEIAQAAGMSTSPCWRRIKRLTDEGVIKGQTVLVDRQKIGLGFVVYAFIKLDPPSSQNIARFEKTLA